MQLTAVLNTSASRIVKVEDPRAFLPQVANTLVERYNFVKYPKTIAEFTGQSLDFEYGNYFNGVLIGKLKLFQDGVIVEAHAPTDQLDGLLDDVFSALAGIGLRAADGVSTGFYVSAIEATLNPGFSGWFEQLQPIIEKVRNSIDASGIPVADYQVGGFSLAGEGSGNLMPGRFVLERRVERPLSANTFFSQAPMSTAEHCKLLSEIEELF
jgi:hypothetical protein